MSLTIETFISNNNIEQAILECLQTNQPYLGKFLSVISGIEINTTEKPLIKIQLLCNWCTSKQLAELWNKMSKGNFTWNNIRIVWEGDVDYYVIINAPPENAIFNKKKTIIFQMEPYMSEDLEKWGVWAYPNEAEFLKIFKHDTEFNNCEWHLSKTYSELNSKPIEKKYDTLCTILSGKYTDPGHVKRIDFIKFLEKQNFPVDVYGENRWDYKNYKGSLPYHCKDEGILPYKYVFNAENHDIKNYFTEKLIDGILGECLVFYSGCFNLREYIDERAYVHLELSNLQKDYEVVRKAIKEDWYTKRLPFIREAKRRILNEMQFFPRLEKFINNLK